MIECHFSYTEPEVYYGKGVIYGWAGEGVDCYASLSRSCENANPTLLRKIIPEMKKELLIMAEKFVEKNNRLKELNAVCREYDIS